MPEAAQAVSRDDMNRRIVFHDAPMVMEADFSDFHFANAQIVNQFYDCLEKRIAKTGEQSWFFLVNLNGTRIDPSAWTAYSRRGRALNLAHSMGSVRFDASEETARQIRRAANTDAFDPNLFSDRDSALARISELPSKRRARPVHTSNHSPEEIKRRVSFDTDRVIMEVDFSNFTLHHSRDVNDVYDILENAIKATDRKWFFLVNLNGCEILPGAWGQYAYRGKRLNKAASLGSARFAAGSETEEDIRQRATSQGFRPNIRNTREEALALLEGLRQELTRELTKD